MAKNLLFLILLFCINTASAQTKAPVNNGIITLSSGATTGFINLRFINDIVVYHDVVTKKEMAYKLSEVSLIRNDLQEVVYKNPTIIVNEQKLIASKTDSLFKPNYPEGIYKTKEDFINKKPSSNENILPFGIDGGIYLEYPLNNCDFLKEDRTKLKKVFAVSYKGHLYFQLKAVTKNMDEDDRGQNGDFPNSFARVITGGKNYFYMEADIIDVSVQSAPYPGRGITVGVSVYKSPAIKKGFVWDFKNQKFTIFKTCEDFNAFIEPLYPEGKQECKRQEANILAVRKAIEKIK
ncbi:hypothetical protein GWA97_13445 [Flavobacterium sp. LaA7.5]|nr:hypothetical protein [Flavobacterium salilacus subsp. altitudinum]